MAGRISVNASEPPITAPMAVAPPSAKLPIATPIATMGIVFPYAAKAAMGTATAEPLKCANAMICIAADAFTSMGAAGLSLTAASASIDFLASARAACRTAASTLRPSGLGDFPFGNDIAASLHCSSQ
jgi:hypothetical protein